jgi:hypothetical protein
MKYIITYKICGKEHEIKVTANTRHHAEEKILNSLQIIECEPEEDETVTRLRTIMGMDK